MGRMKFLRPIEMTLEDAQQDEQVFGMSKFLPEDNGEDSLEEAEMEEGA